VQRLIVIPDSHIRSKVDAEPLPENVKVIKVHESKQAALKIIGVPDDDLLLAHIAIRIAQYFNTLLLVFDNRISDIAFTLLKEYDYDTCLRICLMNVKMPLHYTFRISLLSLLRYVKFGKYLKVLYLQGDYRSRERVYRRLMYKLEQIDSDEDHPGYRIAVFSKDIKPRVDNVAQLERYDLYNTCNNR